MDRGAQKKSVMTVCILLAAVTLGIFWPVTDHDFVEFDDQDYVTENPQVKAGLTWKGAAWVAITAGDPVKSKRGATVSA